MPKKDVVPLSDHRRGLLYALIQKGNAPARTGRRAHTLLLLMNSGRRPPLRRCSIARR